MNQAKPSAAPELVRITASEVCCDESWEQAYARFETPAEERRKFSKRLRRLGAAHWPRDAVIVELFCGRGNGLHALAELGFTHLEGVDLSASLLAQYQGPARCYVCDCRQLPFDTASKDILIVQGGLHHLPTLPDDLERTLREASRVLRPDGRFVVVEPWLTPFLSFTHALCRSRVARRLYNKLDALAVMIECERRTYEQWLGQPQAILEAFDRWFDREYRRLGWGKLLFVGRKRAG